MGKTTNKAMNKATVPAVGAGKRGEQGHIGYLLRQAHAAHRLRMERALADLEVTLPQFSVLTMLAAYPGASGADLARLSLLTPQTMSVIVANLERGGAVSRRPHAVHGRIQQIEVTEVGRQLLAQCRTRIKPVEDELLAAVSEVDAQVIRRWLVNAAVPGSMD